jgi:serine/threonine protein kinase
MLGPMWSAAVSGSSQLAVGDTVGPFRLEAVLGEGGMGVVYRAVRSPDQQRVALKILKPELLGDEVYRKRFLHEARAAQEVQHSHLVPVLEAGEASGQQYLAVAYVEGGTLESLIRTAGPPDLATVVRITAQVGAGLDALHANGLVHRDVKPSNIMLDEDHAAYLTDFGLARGRGYTVLTKPGQVMGTLDYIAPELIKGEPASPASDVYALGCTVHECLAGQPPFAHKARLEAAVAHLEEEPPDPCAGRDDLPSQLSWAVHRALAKDPAQRPPTATAYARMLQVASKPEG